MVKEGIAQVWAQISFGGLCAPGKIGFPKSLSNRDWLKLSKLGSFGTKGIYPKREGPLFLFNSLPIPGLKVYFGISIKVGTRRTRIKGLGQILPPTGVGNLIGELWGEGN